MSTAPISVLIPVLDRPGRVEPLVDNLEECSIALECRPVFIVSPGDERELAAVRKASADHILATAPPGPGDYAKKINLGFELTDSPFVFLAADDLRFTPGWAERAVAAFYETGACVVGTNDLGNRRVTAGRHSTHTLVHRDYGECGTIDEPGVLLHDGYAHNFVDDEFVQTAQSRQTFVAALDSIVEHLHPAWGKSADDATYRRGQAQFGRDRSYFAGRRRLWR